MAQIYPKAVSWRVPDKVPLCVRCDHYRYAGYRVGDLCDRFATERVEEDPVRGAIAWRERPFCKDMRAEDGLCGPAAAGWVQRPAADPEPKPLRWYRRVPPFNWI